MIKSIVVLIFCIGTLNVTLAQAQVAVSVNGAPEVIESEFHTALHFNLIIQGIDEIHEVVVAFENKETKELSRENRQKLIKDDNGYYFEHGQRIYDGRASVIVSHEKNELPALRLIFFVVDKSGQVSLPMYYELNK